MGSSVVKKILFVMALLCTTTVFAESEINAAAEPVTLASSDSSYINNEELVESTQRGANAKVISSTDSSVKKDIAGEALADNSVNTQPESSTESAVKKAPVSSIENSASTPASATTSEAIEIGEGVKIIPKTQHEEDTQLRFTIDVNYPQIEGANLSRQATEFNKLIMQMVNHEVQQFKKYVTLDQVHMQSLPEDLKHNSLRTDYDVDVVKPNKKIIISVRLSNEGFQAGRAHPYHNHKVLNYDMTAGKVLTFAELFKPKSNYLNLISKYANQKLTQKLEDKWMINEGTKPVDKNYQIWNLENDGILITFDEYQVAPYVYGAQEVEIPYSELKAVLSPKAPIFSCANDAESCEGAKNKI
jgi:hypothetical protein